MNTTTKPGVRRDMTKAQFDAALARNGIRRAPFGYYEVTRVVATHHGSRAVGGRRATLALLLKRQAQAVADGDV